jgi:hypothetical protein
LNQDDVLNRNVTSPLSRFGPIAIRSSNLAVDHAALLVRVLGGQLLNDETLARLVLVRNACALCRCGLSTGNAAQNSDVRNGNRARNNNDVRNDNEEVRNGEQCNQLLINDEWLIESIVSGTILRTDRFVLNCPHGDANNRRASVIELS